MTSRVDACDKFIYIYIYIYRQNKCDTPNDELPVERSKKDTVLQLQILDEYRARKHEADF